jgi:pyridoxal phosphate enzyme (YggS family)
MIAERLRGVNARIAAAAERAGRRPESVRLVAVSKKISVARCKEAVAAGQLEFGENYAQELRDKSREVTSARWHFIGPLQRNKVKYVVGTAELIQSVDSLSILEEIAARASAKNFVQRCLVQVNVGSEAQKSGCTEEALPPLLAGFEKLNSVRCEGLMCIPPFDEDPAPYFEKLRSLAERHHLPELSMGMSADYERAIEYGATIVRVGTAIFGART